MQIVESFAQSTVMKVPLNILQEILDPNLHVLEILHLTGVEGGHSPLVLLLLIYISAR